MGSPLQAFYGSRLEVIDRSEISIFQMTIIVSLYVVLFFPLSLIWLSRTWLCDEHDECLIWYRKCVTFAGTWDNPDFMVGSVLLILLHICFVVLCFVCLHSVSCDQCYQCLWIVNSWLPLRFSLRFINWGLNKTEFGVSQHDRKKIHLKLQQKAFHSILIIVNKTFYCM